MKSTHPEGSNDYWIDEELVCVDSLKRVLHGAKDVEIRREEKDPPDFTLTVDGRAFPTEVTSIASRQDYHAQCRRFARTMQERALSLGVLSGTYVLSVDDYPHIPRPSSLDGRRVLDLAVKYIEDTKHEPKWDELLLSRESSGRIGILKFSPAGCSVENAWVSAMWEGEVQKELAQLLQASVDTKRQKLTKVGIRPKEAMLLLYAAYAYADPDDAVAALNQVHGFDWFHSIYWAACFHDRTNTTYPTQPGREGCFLFSHDKQWHRVGTVPLDEH